MSVRRPIISLPPGVVRESRWRESRRFATKRAMEPVDVALCLAMDVSASVDFEEFALMAGGTAAALRDPAVLAAASSGPRGAAAVALLLWS
ncbi:DUF1194 domain-containing protein, partial [Falsiroseomonas oryzae]|uniref:DUF1194 domain-containing protein n=1 Tax=Falsiroseomonas oryzae TaxID=2766473 RepID=UPI002FDBC3B8